MYRIVEVTTYNDGTATAQGMYPYEDDNVAIANFHTKFGSMMKKAEVQTEMCMIITEKGQIFHRYNPDDSVQYFTAYFDRGYVKPEE